MPTFDDATIERLLGSEDAENENAERFKEYFFFNRTYDNLIADLPIRILVGHKGIGKSALLRRAFLENEDDSQLAVWIRPNELVAKVGSDTTREFNQLIENWKAGLLTAIADKATARITGVNKQSDSRNAVEASAQSAIELLIKIAKDKIPNIRDAVSKSMVNNFLTDNKIFIYIDDIDRGWSASKKDIKNISALLNAIRDLAGSNSKLKFRIGLRSDVYFLVRTSDESTDKVERNVIWLSWTNHEILSVMAKRIETFFGGNRKQKDIISMKQRDITNHILSKIITPSFEGRGHWSNRPIHNVLLSLTRKRPRDFIKLMYGAARNAYKNDNNIISSANLELAFAPYSAERLQDIINEFRSEMPQIEAFLLGLRQTKKERRTSESFLYSTDKLILKMKEILSHTNLTFTNGKPVIPKSLIQFLYKIDFITARKYIDGQIERQYFDQNRFLASEFVDFGYDWEVHPAYRWALQPQDVQSILDTIKL